MNYDHVDIYFIGKKHVIFVKTKKKVEASRGVIRMRVERHSTALYPAGKLLLLSVVFCFFLILLALSGCGSGSMGGDIPGDTTNPGRPGTFIVTVSLPSRPSSQPSPERQEVAASRFLPSGTKWLKVVISGENITGHFTQPDNLDIGTGAGTYTMTVSSVPVGLNEALIQVLDSGSSVLAQRKHGFYMTPGGTVSPPGTLHMGVAIKSDGSCDPQNITVPQDTVLYYENWDAANDRTVMLWPGSLTIGPITKVNLGSNPSTPKTFYASSYTFSTPGDYYYYGGYGAPGGVTVTATTLQGTVTDLIKGTNIWGVKVMIDSFLDWSNLSGFYYMWGVNSGTGKTVTAVRPGYFDYTGTVDLPKGLITTKNFQMIYSKCFGGDNVDRCNSMALTTDGGYVMAGFTNSTEGDVTGLHGAAYDLWVVKLDRFANLTWQKCLGGTSDEGGTYDMGQVTYIAQTTDGGYIAAIDSLSNDGQITGHHGTTSYYDCWVVKLDSGGGLSWQKSLGGTNSEYGNCVQQTTDGGYVVATSSYSNDGQITGHHGTTSVLDCWIVKLDSSGGLTWQKSLGGTSDDVVNYIHQTTDGGYVFCGSASSNDGNVTGNHGSFDYWVVKLDSSGGVTWQKCLGGTGSDVGNFVRQTTDGGYVVNGFSGSNDGQVTGNHGNNDFWAAKLDSSGALTWQKSLGGSALDEGTTIFQTPDGGYLATGKSYSNDGQVSGHHGTTSYFDYWIVKFNNSGALSWQKSLGGNRDDILQATQITTDGGYVAAGFSYSTEGDVTGHHGATNPDFWIVKLTDELWGARSYGSITGNINDLAFINTSIGWAAASDGIYKSTDGGFNWTNQSADNYLACHLVDSNNGWAAAKTVGDYGLEYGTIARTTNGGQNWNIQLVSLTIDTWDDGASYYYYWFDAYRDVFFTDSNKGWAVGSYFEYHDPGASPHWHQYARGKILRTVNGGADWIYAAGLGSDNTEFESVYFVNSNVGWTVGQGGIIYKSTNGGVNWVSQNSGTGSTLLKVHFVDSNNGWAVGTGGTIIGTTNGGANWSAQTSGTTADLHSLFFQNSSVGGVVGNNGTVLLTISGGANWAPMWTGTNENLYGTTATDLSHGWAAGTGGIVMFYPTYP